MITSSQPMSLVLLVMAAQKSVLAVTGRLLNVFNPPHTTIRIVPGGAHV